MYTKEHSKAVEDICYQLKHIEKVLSTINANFDDYFNKYLKSRKSHIAEEQIDKLRERFIVDSRGKQLVFNAEQALEEVSLQAIIDYEKDRDGYKSLFDKEILEEYIEDPQQFKSVALKIETAIIRKTIQNKYEKRLDKFRSAFSRANANELLKVVTRLADFSNDYINNVYDSNVFENTVFYKDFGLSILDTDDYTAHGVIGGGIRSTILYKNYPEVFPCRSRMSLWALWFLVGKKTFDCTMDSEFLMIDVNKNLIQQNYFYPYELFVFYALQIFLLIKDRAINLGVELDKSYRFIYVEAFLNFVAMSHNDEISLLSNEYEEKAYV